MESIERTEARSHAVFQAPSSMEGRFAPSSSGNDGGPSEDGPPLPVRFAR